MKLALLFIIAVLGFSACVYKVDQPKKETGIFKDTVAYQYKTIHERAADCGSKPDSTCTVAHIKYPEFSNQSQLNDTIKGKLIMMFAMDGKSADTSLAAMAKNFIASYERFKKESPKSPMFYELQDDVKVVQQDSALIALEYNGYTFQGGAHGASFTGFINWNPAAKKEVLLKDVLIDNYQPELTKIAEKIFRKNEKLSDTTSLKTNYFFKGDKFALNENYSITPLGVKFVYNQYEIKPYAAGQTELFIPYAQIKTLVRPNTVASQFLK
ncbi:DUF3298 and DUF4163 domain-containing protein [Mucilaginibacter pallidiroseus]|uniref:DUF3298 and DUF4163 domain-containing protein n=1 Tax=Mucilaginibacter pallidiroseus TaxID=2599295 RepID=A0A563UIT2_9SPHI|nr:DUF3298 and DUF4163 domain-containing protein [Mucilaginibacter pallidiroseus]TWR31294.1 DUF3298 and DUF4163 domain-containing protein [Mucilaginibacter pallidiroseus]